jgi:hypothetical protein
LDINVCLISASFVFRSGSALGVIKQVIRLDCALILSIAVIKLI